jgi:sialic acid synthase SpsE
MFHQNVKINNSIISNNSKPYLVAEIGLNHNNDIEIGKRTIEAAANSGANAVKFQSYITEEFIDPKNQEAKFLFDIFKKYELSEKSHIQFQKTAFDLGVDFFSTPLCKSSINLLISLNVPALKIASGDIVNFELLKKAAESKLPILLSSGAADFSEVTRAVDFLEKSNVEKLILFHCISIYPTPLEKLNLNTIQLYKSLYDIPIGFSDHSNGFLGAVIAVSMGARIIEKHFTLDKNLDGPDHTISLNPEEFKSLSENTIIAYQMLGEKTKKPYPEEVNGRFYGRRSAYLQNSNPINLRPALHTKDPTFLDSWEMHKILSKVFKESDRPLKNSDI